MFRSVVLAAAAATVFALSAPAPAQARMYNPVLNEIAPANPLVQETHYRRYRHSHRSRYRSRGQRYRHCYNQRVRVRVPGGRLVFRTRRHCEWRYHPRYRGRYR